MLIVTLICNPLLLSCSCTLMYCSSTAIKKKTNIKKVKEAPTNLVASMCKLTFKQTLCEVNEEHCLTSIYRKNGIMSETEHIGYIYKIFGKSYIQ